MGQEAKGVLRKCTWSLACFDWINGSLQGTSYVDEDWGGVNESEEELLELEEEDAIARQKKLDSAIAAVDYDALADTADLVDEAEEKRVEKRKATKWEEMTEEERLRRFLELSPELEEMVIDYKEKVCW